MKSYSLGLYEKAMPASLCWLEKLGLAKDAGYDYIEISIDETDEKLARIEKQGSNPKDISSRITSDLYFFRDSNGSNYAGIYARTIVPLITASPPELKPVSTHHTSHRRG